MKGTKTALLGAVLAAATFGTITHQARADKTWNNASSPAWLTSGNWSPTGVPSSSDIAFFGSVGPSNGIITIDMNGATNNGTANQIVGEIVLITTKNRTISNSSTTAAGTLTLNGVGGVLLSNSASGAYTLALNNGSSKTMNVAFANPGNIAVSSASAFISIASNAGGAVDLAKTGNGTLRLSGNNSFGGAGHSFTIKGGAVDANADAALGDANTLWILDAGTFQSSQPGPVTYAHSFQLDSGGGTFTCANDMILSGNISGAGGLTKSGAGTLTLSGPTPTYAGPTNFNSGIICLNTDLAGLGAVSVAGAGTAAALVGNATIAGPTTVTAAGTIQPGPTYATPSPGGLTFTNGLTFNTGAQYAWDLNALSTANPGTDFSVIHAGSALSIAAGAQLTLSFTGAATSPDGPAKAFWTVPHDWIIASSAASTGAFTIANNSANDAFSVTTTGQNVVLHYAAPFTGPRTLAWAGASGGAIADSSGTWDAANDNWVNTSDASQAIWNSANPDIAVFGAGRGNGGTATVTLRAPVTTGQATFAANSAAYTLTGDALTINGVAGVGIHAHSSATINSDILPAGEQTWAVDSGATLTVAGNVSAACTITKTGPGTLTCRGHNALPGFTVTAGTLVLDSPGAAGAGALTISNAAAVQLTPGESKVLVLPALTMDNTASLDLADHDLVVHHGDAARIQTLINQACNDPDYNTPGVIIPGITSSSHTALTTLGTLTGAAYRARHGAADFATVSEIAADDVLAKYTWFGDLDLDGLVTPADCRLMDAGYLAGFDGVAKFASWADGDVNHDQIVDYKDFALADASLGQTTALGQSMFAAHSTAFGAAYVTAYSAAVPEPATLSLFGFAAPLLFRRRRA